MELLTLTAIELSKKIKAGEVTVAEAVEAALAQIKACEPELNSFVTVDEEGARAQAQTVQQAIDAGICTGPLAGVPVAIKDNMCTLGLKTTCSSRILEDYVPTYEAEAVIRLRKAGAVILGKTNMDEFAMGSTTETSAFGPTKNPWNTAHVPGGSSGGSCSAVASGEAFCALGSDTGGSIRQPSSFCGVVGMKPTYGRVSRYGLVAYASSLDQIGPITKDVTDCANILNIIAGRDEMDSTSIDKEVPDYTKSLVQDVKGLKIGLPKEYFVKGMDPEVEGAVKAAVKQLEELGAEVVEISLPNTDYAISTYYLIAPAEAATNLARYDGVSYGERAEDAADLVEMMTKTRSQYLGEEVKRRIMIGNYALSAGYYDAYYLKALKVRRLVKEDYDKAFKDVDVIICPAAPSVAYKIGEKIDNPLEMYLQDACTVPLNLAGLPGISVPCGYNKDKMPIGMQIIGKALDEETLIRVAYTYEQSQSYHQDRAQLGGK